MLVQYNDVEDGQRNGGPRFRPLELFVRMLCSTALLSFKQKGESLIPLSFPLKLYSSE